MNKNKEVYSAGLCSAKQKEELLLLAACQLHLNRLKIRTNQEKIKNIGGLERVRDLLLVAESEPTTVGSVLIEVKSLLERMIPNTRVC